MTLAGPSSQSTTTGADGSYTFNNVEGGAYAVSISNIPADFVFSTTSQAVTITTDGQTQTVSFAGQVVRTGSISGEVSASGDPVQGVSVTLSGDDGDETRQTNSSGSYSFTGLQSGSYTVSIENPNEDVYTFSTTEQDVTLTAGESEVVNFAGTREGGGDGTGEDASVVIQGVTNAAGGSVPTNALAGTIVARANIDEGDQDVSSIEFKIGDQTVCTQTFGGAPVDGQQSGDNFTADCTINTAAFDTETGEPMFLNGASTLTVEVETAAGDTETATIDIGLANADMFFATDITPENTAIAPATGNLWWGGDVDVTVVPVMYSGRTVARVTANFAGGAETDMDPSDGFTFSFTAAAADAGDADFIGNVEAVNQTMTASGVTEGGANIGASALTTQNYDDVAPAITDASGNLPPSRWVNAPFTFGGVTGADGGVGGTDFFFEAGTSAATLEPVETGEDLEASLTNDTYIVQVTAEDELGNEQSIFIDGTAAGTTTAAAATEIGADFVDPEIDDVSGLEDGDIINGGQTFTIELEADDRSGFNDPIRIFVERFLPNSTTCVLEDTADECDPTNLGTGTGLNHTLNYNTDVTPSAVANDAYYRPHFFAVDQAANASDPMVITHVRDTQNPAVGGIGFASVLEAGESEDFTAPISDNLDIDEAELFLDYGGNFILFAEENVGGFGPDDGFVTSQTLSATVNPFVGWIEDGLGGPFWNPDNARVDVFDFGDNTGTVTTAITATIDAPAQVSYGDAARGDEGQVTGATFTTEEATICGDATCTTNPTATEVELEITGESGELVNHFSQVYFYTELDAFGSMEWQRVEQGSVDISDDGIDRFYTYTGTLTASDFDAYAGGALETHNIGVLAIADDGTAIWFETTIDVADD